MAGQRVPVSENMIDQGPGWEKRRSDANVISWNEEDHKNSHVEQSHKESCDINFIMKKYERTGTITHIKDRMPQFGDFTTVTDYQSAMNSLVAAEQAFMALPAKVRAEFDNDPGKYLKFMDDPKNIEKMVEMGLATEVGEPDLQIRDVVNAINNSFGERDVTSSSGERATKKKTAPEDNLRSGNRR